MGDENNVGKRGKFLLLLYDRPKTWICPICGKQHEYAGRPLCNYQRKFRSTRECIDWWYWDKNPLLINEGVWTGKCSNSRYGARVQFMYCSCEEDGLLKDIVCAQVDGKKRYAYVQGDYIRIDVSASGRSNQFYVSKCILSSDSDFGFVF